VYVSLLPNQIPRDTTVLIDDFTVHEIHSPAQVAKNAQELVVNGGFAKDEVGAVKAPWYFANIGGNRIAGRVIEVKKEKAFQIAMNKNTTNLESARLWQMVNLEKGVRYEVRCRMRWDNYEKADTTPIVNYGFHHFDSNTSYGPIDQTLKKSPDWEDYSFVHVPTYDGPWQLYVQLNGWGNFGQQLTVSFTDFSCRAVK